jgi:hypothetical protein
MTTLVLLNQVSQWWDELILARKVFYGIGVIAAVIPRTTPNEAPKTDRGGQNA